MSEPEPEGRSDILSVLGKVAGLSLLPAVYLYFSGFVYTYFYFQHLGVPLQNTELPVYYFIVYAFPVLYQSKLAVVLTLLCLLGAIALLYKKPPLGTALLGTLLVLLFPLAYSGAKQLGVQRAVMIRHGIGARRVHFTLDSEAAKAFPQEFLTSNDNGDLVLLGESADYFNVLLQRISNEPDLPRAYVFRVSKDKVLVAKITIEEIKRIKL